uniref:Uncharacterized protein n=1 Tax=Zea mays TaxID=4577 RepID=C4J7V1_MAIZE|nr:unknown [Zea mays]ACR37295.1 unknown [Zea mays]
MARFCGSLSTS